MFYIAPCPEHTHTERSDMNHTVLPANYTMPCQARDQTRLACEFGANSFSGSRDIYLIQKNKNNKQKVTDSTKNRSLLACGKK